MTITRREFLTATGALITTAITSRPTHAIDSPVRNAWTLPPRRPFHVLENEWIPLSDGTQLGVRLWLPEGAEHKSVPVVLEYLPYRKRDDLRKRDDTTALNLAPYGI